MKLFHKRGGEGQPDFISRLQKYMPLKKARKNQNKDFITAVRGGHHFMKSFHKILFFFLNDGFPYPSYPLGIHSISDKNFTILPASLL